MAGGSSAPTKSEVTQTSTTLPKYAEPYVMNMLERGQAQSYQPYVPYGQQRIAGFTPNQTTTQANVMGMQAPTEFGTASNLASQAGLASLTAGQYTPMGASSQQVGLPSLTNYQMAQPGDVQGGVYTAPGMATAQTGYNPALNTFQMAQPGDVQGGAYTASEMAAAQTGFDPSLNTFQQAGPDAFGQAQVDQYMSPYVRNVLDVQKRNAITDAQKTQLMANLGAAKQGTYGGARQLLAGTERERALGQNLSDIEAKGMQSAYENAQGQFERDRAAQVGVGRTNLEAQLGVQQLGTQTGMQTAFKNLDAQQQASVQNQAAQMQAMGYTQDQAMRAALANQQAGLTVGQQNLNAQLQTQQLGTNTGLQAALANLTAEQQTNAQNLAAQMQAMGYTQDQAMRAALANQQMEFNTGQQNLGAQLQTQQLGTQTGLQALLANQDADLKAQQLAEQSRQFGGTLGLQGLQQANQAAATLGNLGTARTADDIQRFNAQNAVGKQQQDLQQSILDQQYGDFLRQRDYSTEQLGYYNNLIRGLPMQMNSTQTSYAPPPSTISQVGGLGLGALGMYNMGR